jgi:multiple sugar transport system substrate-binding protein
MRRNLRGLILAGAAATGLLVGCSGSPAGSGEDGTLTLWTHNGGNEAELGVLNGMVADFNASQQKYKVKVQSFPQASYNEAVTAAASAKKLPCILDVDGPIVPNWAWAGYLEPLDLPADTFANQLPGTLGRVGDELYSFGHYDVALNIVARKSALEDNGIRIPSIDKPWTQEEFDAALTKIKSAGKFQYPLDLGTGGSGEWIPYAYSPILQSFGADLISRDSSTTAEGVLNSPEALRWADWFQSTIENGYAARKSGSDATVDFVNGKTAIMYSGSWAADAVTQKFKDDVLFLPPPDFGHGPKIGAGSWQWAMSSGCSAKEGALEYLKFTTDKKYYVNFAKTLGLIPGNTAAASEVPNFAPGGKYQVFLQFADKFAVIRPPTPAYPFISTTFQKATQDIISGGDPEQILDRAVADIDNNIKTNGGYKF